jgi:hypothetical protein
MPAICKTLTFIPANHPAQSIYRQNKKKAKRTQFSVHKERNSLLQNNLQSAIYNIHSKKRTQSKPIKGRGQKCLIVAADGV